MKFFIVWCTLLDVLFPCKHSDLWTVYFLNKFIYYYYYYYLLGEKAAYSIKLKIELQTGPV